MRFSYGFFFHFFCNDLVDRFRNIIVLAAHLVVQFWFKNLGTATACVRYNHLFNSAYQLC